MENGQSYRLELLIIMGLSWVILGMTILVKNDFVTYMLIGAGLTLAAICGVLGLITRFVKFNPDKKIFTLLNIISRISVIVVVVGLIIIISFTNYESLYENYLAHQIDDEARTYGINATEDCYDYCSIFYRDSRQIKECIYNKNCAAQKVFYQLASEFHYMNDPGKLYNTSYLLETKRADCKNYATLFCKILYNMGIDCDVRCSIKEKHCLNVVTTEKSRLIFDLTREGVGAVYFPENQTNPFDVMRSKTWW